MRELLAAMLLAVTATAAAGEEVLARFLWEGETSFQEVSGARMQIVADGAGPAWLRVERSEAGPPISLRVIENPAITSATYAIRTRVRHEGVEGVGYLEMWSQLPDGSRFFSRTLQPRGAGRSLSGFSAWRHVVLPFFRSPDSPAPTMLEVNLVLPGRGTVELGPLELIQFGPGEDPLALPGQWWTARQAGLIGGILGLILGCCGAAIGVLAARRRATRLVIGLLWGLTAAGLAAVGAGLVAAFTAQPWEVFYPLLLAGGIASIVAGTLLPVARRRLAAIELARMRAQDL